MITQEKIKRFIQYDKEFLSRLNLQLNDENFYNEILNTLEKYCISLNDDKTKTNIFFTNQDDFKSFKNDLEDYLNFIKSGTGWYYTHADHVTNIIKNVSIFYMPSNEDLNQINLWKPNHWKWFIKNYIKVEKTIWYKKLLKKIV